MSFTYAELKTAIQDFTENNEPSFVRNIPLFIRLAEERILKNVQLNLFRQNSTARMSFNNAYLEVPNDFLAPYSLSYTPVDFPQTVDSTWNPNGTYNLSQAILKASVGENTPYPFTTLFQDAEAIPGRALADISGSGGPYPITGGDSLDMLKYIQGTLNSSSSEYAYIENYMLPYMQERQEDYSLYYDVLEKTSEFLDFKDVSFIRSYQRDTNVIGKPRYYAQFNEENFVIAPIPDRSYIVQLGYFYRPTSLTAGAESGTTWLSKNAELAMFYGALIEAAIYMKEEPDIMQMYMARFQESLVGIKMLGEAKETTDEYRTGKVVRQKQ